MASTLLRVVVTRKLPAAALAPLVGKFNINMWESEEPMPPAALLDTLRAAPTHGIICTLTDVMSAEILAAAPDLRVLSTMSVGYSHIAVPAACASGVRIGFVPNALTETTADLVLALTLATCRRVNEALTAARVGEWKAWKPYWMCGKDLHSSRVGIVGLGRIGVAVARRLRGFGCDVAYTGASGRKADAEAAIPGGATFLPLDDLLQRVDVVILLCALTPATRGLMTEARLSSMKEDAVLINVSRGEVVDQDALIRVMRARPGMRAGLDVTTPEPLPLDSPLFALPNVTVLPHIGSATVATRTAMAHIAVANAVAGLQGTPLEFEVPESVAAAAARSSGSA